MRRHLSKTQCSITLPRQELNFQLSRSGRRRTIAIHIEENGEVTVSAPRYSPQSEIESFIREKSDWISRKSRENRQEWQAIQQKRFADGESFLFLGKKYPLSVELWDGNRCRVHFECNRWTVRVPQAWPDQKREQSVNRQMRQWFQRQAREVLACRAFHYARIMGLSFKKLGIRGQKRIWGSCHPQQGYISLNWKLVLAPIDVIDYVIVHELSHLRVANHSRKFWREVAEVLPDFRIRQHWLKKHAAEMALPEETVC